MVVKLCVSMVPGSYVSVFGIAVTRRAGLNYVWTNFESIRGNSDELRRFVATL